MSTTTNSPNAPVASEGQGTSLPNRGYKPSYGDDDVIDLGRIFGLLVDAKWFLLGITTLFAGTAGFYGTVATPIYQGDTLIQVERKAGMNPLEDVTELLMAGGEAAATAAEVQILQSRMVLGAVVDQLDLQTEVTLEGFGLLGGFLRRSDVERPGWASGSAAVWAGETLRVGRFEADRPYLGEPLSLEAGTQGQYTLSFEGESLGTGTVGELESFADGRITLRIAELGAGEGAEWTLLRNSRLGAIDAIKENLSVSEVGGRGDSTGMIQLTLKGPDVERITATLNGIAETFMRQNVARQAEQAERSLAFLRDQSPKLQGELSRAEEALNDYRIQVDSVDLTSEAEAALESFVEVERQLNELEFEEAELSQLFTPTHPQYQSLNRRRSFLENQKADLEARINDLPVSQQEVLRLTRDVQVSQEIYVSLLNRLQELEIARAGTIGNVRIIDDAVVVPRAVEPKRSLLFAIAGFLGFFCAAGLVLLRSAFNRGIEVPEQLEQLGLSVYATVPRSEAGRQAERRNQRESQKEDSAKGKGLLARFGVRPQPRARKIRALLAALDPSDHALEALRGLRTALHFALMEGNQKVVAISGASPGVGKTFISCNLAAVYAQTGQRVLVIDTDMRRGHVHTMLRGARTPGLSEYLAGDIAVEQALQDSRVYNLSFIARGTVPPNPSELLMNARFHALLDSVREQFDVVIVDTPPILPVTDGAIAAKACDGVFLVAQFDRTTPKEIELSLSRLEASGAKAKGAVLNQVERKAASYYGYYGYYNYNYSYGYKSAPK